MKKNDFNLALVAEIDERKKNKFSPVKSEDWKYFLDYFRKRGNVSLFDWKDLEDNFKVRKHIKADDKKISIVNNPEDIRHFCNLIYIGQLGEIGSKKDNFIKFLDILEGFPGKVMNPLETIRDNLSKQYILYLQDKDIPVIPTLDVNQNWKLNDIRKLNFPNYGKAKEGIVLKPKYFGEQGKNVIMLDELKNEFELNTYLERIGEVIAQPLIKEIYSKGENSFIFLGNEFSHGLNKLTGKFKINFCESSKYTKIFPTQKETDLCEKVLEIWPKKIGYSRIDIIPGKKPLIGEVEMVNPAGYLAETNSKETYSRNLEKKLNEYYLER
jgi:glutathione synthase/RimK-type ligase-like ATP-grasp enzyme